ncbi:MAG TPA: Holliday junction resolvase RuvX [Acidimicrobiales bacterium]|jgi:putative Holliday junction resolvase|nr:Holliday junction resolvase RuvX [Acidimicrobiales bacterium]
MSPDGRLLGLDLGSRRIGVAVSDSARTLATGAATIHRDRLAVDHAAIAALVSEYEAVGVIVGVPYSMSGEVGAAAQAVLDEIKTLADVLPVPVSEVDERLTTVVASSRLSAAGRSSRQQRSVIDQTAAAALLQTWIDRQAALGRRS